MSEPKFGLLPGGCTAYFKRETPEHFPERHLAEALRLFDKKKFDYIGSATGYEQTKGWRLRLCSNFCGQTLGDTTDLNGDKRPDVECLAGLVQTPAWNLEYDWDGEMPKWRGLNLTRVLSKGDVLQVGNGIPPEGPIDMKGCRHFMYVKETPEWKPDLGGERGGWKFEVFHSQRAGIGPETSTVWVVPKGEGKNTQYYVYILGGDGSPLDSFDFAFMRDELTPEGEVKPVRQLAHQKLDGLTLKHVYRATAKKCETICDRTIRSPRDPLLLDLDGNGIQTCGLGADLHFDHDADGFAELTGWVDWGDGVLMLDKNGNNKLDDGSELLGDYTILSDGKRSTDGFGSLTFYDADGNGRIDASDPIWSELRYLFRGVCRMNIDLGCLYLLLRIDYPTM